MAAVGITPSSIYNLWFQSSFVTRAKGSARWWAMTINSPTPSPFRNKFDWERALNATDTISPTAHHVAVTLAGFMDKNGKAYVSRAKLAAAVKRSIRTVDYATLVLETQGWIRRRKGTRGRATTYWMAAPENHESWSVVAQQEQPHLTDTQTSSVRDNTLRGLGFVRRALEDTGIDPAAVDFRSDSISRLVTVIARQMSSDAGDQNSLQVLYGHMTQGSLVSAGDPGAVLLYRYAEALRLHPRLRPRRPEAFVASTEVMDIISKVASRIGHRSTGALRE